MILIVFLNQAYSYKKNVYWIEKDAKASDMKLFLASESPRRKELLSLLKIPFRQLSYDFDERGFENEWRFRHACTGYNVLSQALAKAKAEVAQMHLKALGETDYVILTADTVVVLDNVLFGKGETREKSIRMLETLSNRTHNVITSVCAIDSNGGIQEESEKTEVRFAKLSLEEITHYVDSEKPYDKAGAYGIQEGASIFVEGIIGDFFNIVGLPVRLTYQMLSKYLRELY